MEWNRLTELTKGKSFAVERVRVEDSGVAIEGDFELPALARLAAEDQAFVAAFVHCHGSIKQMEEWFGVSYPTIKNRLNRLGEALDFVSLNGAPEPDRDAVIESLERGDISVDEALEKLEQ